MPDTKTPALTRVEAETIQGQGQKLQHREIQKKWRQSRDVQGLEDVKDAGDAVRDVRVCLS
ncbi:hypothetical protein ACSS6W_010201 [Trichoderma asperelloides]